MDSINFSKTVIKGGFWRQKQDMVRNSTVKAVYNRFKETGRFDAFKCDWKEGMPNKPHFYWDSDVAKWIEGVAYMLMSERNAELEAIIDEVVDNIEKNQYENGYFNSYYITIEPENIFTNRDRHELYCLGHLLEGAIAYYQATGKRKFLDMMCKYVDLVEKRFKIDRDTPFTTPGHEEIELALVRLWELTGEKKYLELSSFFVDMRGTAENDAIPGRLPINFQTHAPVREQKTAEGHAVRAVYLYCAMADLAYYKGDESLKVACETLFDNIISKRMYITGGIGSSAAGEAFTVDYDLPSLLAYTETCAALGLALFANRMLRLEADSKYADVVERVIYNGFMSSTSLDGKSFYYENPLEILPYLPKRDVSAGKIVTRWPKALRSEVFDCSCCPPNIVRFIPSIANMLYTSDDTTLYVHQFMESETEAEIGGKAIKIEQTTNYPEDGKIAIKVSGADIRVAVRIPAWVEDYTGETVKGYAYFDVKDGETLRFDFDMTPKFIEARQESIFTCGKYAVMRGPVLYCMESVDNGAGIRDIRLASDAEFKYSMHSELGVPCLTVKAYRRKPDENAPLYYTRKEELVETEAMLIPYYAFANRGEAEMQVWHFVK